MQQLTNRAIASDSKFKKLSERITIIDERLEATGQRIDYTKKKQWTNYISTNPVDIIQNIFGGGGVQRDRIAIADYSSAYQENILLSKDLLFLKILL